MFSLNRSPRRWSIIVFPFKKMKAYLFTKFTKQFGIFKKVSSLAHMMVEKQRVFKVANLEPNCQDFLRRNRSALDFFTVFPLSS